MTMTWTIGKVCCPNLSMERWVRMSVPKFDLRQAFPTMSVTSWHLVQKSLELAEEPKEMVAICPDVDKIIELQTLAAIHELKCNIILIAKGEDKEKEGAVKGHKSVLLPFMGNWR